MAEVKEIKKTKKTSASRKPTVKADVKKEASKKVVNGKTVESAVSAPVFDMTGKQSGKVTLPKELFAGKINATLVAQAVRVYLTNQRQGTVSTKTRSEVKGSRRKVWRQKGTGRARHGSITGPIFVGGGIVHGPKPREFSLKMPKKMKLQALISALTEKQNENKIFVIDGKFSGKTKEFAAVLKTIAVKDKKQPSILFVRNKANNEAKLAGKNIERLDMVDGGSINTYGVVKNSALVIEKSAIEEMKKIFIKTA